MAKRKKKQKDVGFVVAPVEAPDTPDYVIAELRYDMPVALEARGVFGAPAARETEATGLNQVLAGFAVKSVASHFGLSAAQMARHATQATRSLREKVTAEFAQSGFVQIVLEDPKQCAKLAKRMKKSAQVWDAYVAPRPLPAAMATGTSTDSRNFEPAQGYLHSPPDGIGAMEVWPIAGGKGKGIRICDIEGNWNFAHEDLPAGISLLGGTLIPSLGWRNHGTAVLGEMVSRPNDFGTVGISSEARAAVHSAVIGGVFNAAGAITSAASSLKKGDVILIELHAPSPLTGKYIAMQYWNDIFLAIKAATAKGITVVEAAGNGNENFDLPIYAGSGLQKDSGAIVVGAGIPPTNFFDRFGFGTTMPGYSNIGVPRSRIWFSNYGRIVNVQGWGWHVTTCGYGDAQGGADENKWYTLRFSGTSSASPIVTGAVACLQGAAKAKLGSPLPPATVRKILMATGTPQQAGPGVPLTQHIGPLPNLSKAFGKL
jgi:hypothetical protein